MKALRIGGMVVELHDDLTVTCLPDGKRIPAAPQDDDAYRARAAELGYGDDLAAMSRDHELSHAILAALLGLPESPTLRGVAEGAWWPHWRQEEAAALSLQQFARAAGVDLVEVASRMRSALEGESGE